MLFKHPVVGRMLNKTTILQRVSISTVADRFMVGTQTDAILVLDTADDSLAEVLGSARGDRDGPLRARASRPGRKRERQTCAQSLSSSQS